MTRTSASLLRIALLEDVPEAKLGQIGMSDGCETIRPDVPRKSEQSNWGPLSGIGGLTLKSSWQTLIHPGLPSARGLVYEGIVLHDQDRKQKSENEMAMKYQQGTVYLRAEGEECGTAST
jgi:hypothetical protein